LESQLCPCTGQTQTVLVLDSWPGLADMIGFSMM